MVEAVPVPAEELVLVRLERREAGEIAWVSVERPQRLNALDSPTMAAFVETFASLARRADLRVVVLRGAGDRAFVGGADLYEMAALAGPEQAERFITRVHQCCAAVRDLPVPVIARINGFTLGAGLELAAACDLRVATSTSVFGMPEVKVGVPSVVEAALLPALIGWGRTRELLLCGENIDATTARDWGLVERVVGPVESGELDAAVEKWIVSLLAAGPRAVRLQKSLIRSWEELPMSEAIAAGIRSFREAWRGDEPRRMMGEFVRRKRAR